MSEEKKCGNQSCACADEKKVKPANLPEKQIPTPEKKPEEEKLDPTHFGDWQVNCRAIDF